MLLIAVVLCLSCGALADDGEEALQRGLALHSLAAEQLSTGSPADHERALAAFALATAAANATAWVRSRAQHGAAASHHARGDERAALAVFPASPFVSSLSSCSLSLSLSLFHERARERERERERVRERPGENLRELRVRESSVET